MVNMSEMKVALLCFIVAACKAASTAAFKRRRLQADLGAASAAIPLYSSHARMISSQVLT